jgi:hypothetical protein
MMFCGHNRRCRQSINQHVWASIVAAIFFKKNEMSCRTVYILVLKISFLAIIIVLAFTIAFLALLVARPSLEITDLLCRFQGICYLPYKLYLG